jgi:hypothetical protein
MLQRGMTETAAQAAGISALMRQVSVAATVRSFDDCFLLATIVSIMGVLPVLFLKRNKKTAHHEDAVVLE